MEFKEVLQNRVSTRSYNGKPVAKEQIDEILEMMRRAPTARHLEAYKVKISQDPSFLDGIGEATGQMNKIKGCGAVFVFFAVPNDTKYGEKSLNLFPVQDATLACAYAQLAATNLGLSTLWMGAFDDEKLRKFCGVSADIKPVAILIVGYSDEKPEMSDRKELKEILI